MRVNLLFGFLGSGKTTLARRLLDERGRDMRTAVIVNEFGDVGIDGEILRGANIDMIELNSGCMCCTLKGSLMLAIEELYRKAGVERVIVEATGVAQPGELLEMLADSTLDARIEIGPLVTVVDAARFHRLDAGLGEFYEAQIANADIVVLNKVDLADAKTLEDVRATVAQINPRGMILFAERAEVDSRLVLDGDLSALIGEAAMRRGGAVADSRHHAHPGHDHDHDHHAGEPHAESFVLDAGGNPPRRRLEAFFAALPEDVWRVKGFMRIDGQPVLVQYSTGQLEITPAEARTGEILVFIGRRMNRVDIARDFAFAARVAAGVDA